MQESPHKSSNRWGNIDWTLWLLIFTILGLIVSTGWLWYQNQVLQKAITALTVEYNDRAALLSNQLAEANFMIADLQEKLGITKEELADLERDYEREREKNEDFEDQIRDISGTVRDLDKLSKTDEELLQKYSRVYFLNENFIPSDLDKISSKYILEGKKDQYFHGDALQFLEDMLDDANDDDIELKIVSAYRSFDEQREVKNGHTVVYGVGANTFSADQGYSEHQLGTTVDLTTPEVGGAYESFANTEAYEWLLKNAYKYGFVLSYPEGNQFYVFEPWHWRFVGRDLARDLRRDDANFYDWEQRKIDEYLLEIFD